MAEHTSGPWFVGPTPKYLGMHQWADGKARKSSPLTIRSPHHTEEIATVWTYLLPTEANARLIAAAPDLLAALEEAVAILEGFRTHAFLRGSAEYVLGIARPAIAKAKGA